MKRTYKFMLYAVVLEIAAIGAAVFGTMLFEHFYQLAIAAAIATWLTEK